MPLSHSSLAVAGRLLLQDEVMPPAAGEPEPEPESTLALRLIGLFVILVSGFLGGVLPLVSKVFKNPGHPATLVLRAASAGVILALAIIHVLPEGIEQLGAVHEYPFGSLAAIVGVLIMIATEALSRSYLHNAVHGHSHAIGYDNMPGEPNKEPPAEAHVAACDATPTVACLDAGPSHYQDVHTHTCITAQSAANWGATPQGGTIREQVLAYMFELACITHSVLIGIALGVVTEPGSEGVALILALVFHQALEGIGLGSTLIRAGFSTLKCFTMIVTYSIMTPLGVAIGIAVTNSYDPESVAALAIQGTLNSLSAGLLLYIALVQLIAEDFTRADVQRDGADWLRAGMYAALLVGVGAMAIIGIWA